MDPTGVHSSPIHSVCFGQRVGKALLLVLARSMLDLRVQVLGIHTGIFGNWPSASVLLVATDHLFATWERGQGNTLSLAEPSRSFQGIRS
jgi:hypothetical protein